MKKSTNPRNLRAVLPVAIIFDFVDIEQFTHIEDDAAKFIVDWYYDEDEDAVSRFGEDLELNGLIELSA